MRAVTYTEARNNLARELDRVVDDCDVTIITRQKAEATVIMSMREYESLMETAHLLRNPKNAMRLMKAIGVDHCGVADTIGVGTPLAVRRAMERALKHYPLVEVSGVAEAASCRTWASVMKTGRADQSARIRL